MRRAPHEGQNPRRLQLKASSLSRPRAPTAPLTRCVPRSRGHWHGSAQPPRGAGRQQPAPVADAEIPLDVWLNYPGVILPEALARAQN
jgi:hypothetical protein